MTYRMNPTWLNHFIFFKLLFIQKYDNKNRYSYKTYQRVVFLKSNMKGCKKTFSKIKKENINLIQKLTKILTVFLKK